MNILILSCNTGQGHNSVANAIAESLEVRGHTCQIADALGFVSRSTSKVMSWGHSFIYCHCPEVFSLGYGAAERHPETLSERSMAYRFFGLGASDLYNYCQKKKFDCVICTHVFASLMLTHTMRTYDFSIPCYFVATDYTSYPGIKDSHMDAFFIPDDVLAPAYENKKTVTSGIPVYQRFWQNIDKAAAKQALDIPLDAKHILIMCGSMGCGPIEEIAQKIAAGMEQNCIVSIVCGTNHRLYQKLSTAYENDGRVRVYGFLQNIPQMMASADLYVTKPGGISTTEAMATGLPMVLVDAVAGCEDYNMHYFQVIGGALVAKEPEHIASLCLRLIADETRLAEMSACLRKNRKNGAQIICDYLQDHC